MKRDNYINVDIKQLENTFMQIKQICKDTQCEHNFCDSSEKCFETKDIYEEEYKAWNVEDTHLKNV